MNYRDSSIATHYTRGVIVGADSSHGVRLEGGSTGGVIEAVGDDANISLSVKQKGSGALQLGNGSTSPLLMIQRHRIDWTIGALSSAGTAGASVDSTVTLSGATTNSIFVTQVLRPLNSTESTGLYVTVRCSTADELRVTTLNTGPSTLSGSTASIHVLQFKF